ncbi:hypothetical protein Tco_0220517 [Tanacetum coccineum]
MTESLIEVTDQGDFLNDQQDWEIVTWRLYEACGVFILEFKDGTVIHMLGNIDGIYRFDETKEQKNETRNSSALWDSRRLEVKQ